MSDAWEGLRKKARGLENAIDVKLVSLNKLTSNNSAARFDSSDKAFSSRQTMFETLDGDIEGLLAQLATVNDEMNDVVARNSVAGSSSGWTANPAVQHTLRRHREILRDYGIEFNRARSNIRSQLDRESLFNGGSSDDAACLNNRAKPSDMYLKENEHISSCDRLLDEQMSMAMSTKENLARQSSTMRGISLRMNQIARKYPMLGSVMQKIQSKKRRDTVILAGVISSCLIFMFIYIMH